MFTILVVLGMIAFLALGIQIVIEDDKRIKKEEQERMKEAYKEALKEYSEEINNV